MTSGFSDNIQLHDMRKPEVPLCELRGHIKGKSGTIYKPVFVSNGAAVACAGPDSDTLSLYEYDATFTFA